MVGVKRGVLFFNPPYRSLAKEPGAGDIVSQIPLVPLGPGSMFAYVSLHAGLPCYFYYAPDHSVRRIREVIRKRSPMLIAVSCNSYNRFACLAIAGIAKKIDPSIRVVFGGVHATFLDEQILFRYPFVDHVIRGEGEETLLELARALKDDAALAGIDGLSFRDGKRVVRNKPRVRAATIDRFALIDYEYFLSQGMKNIAPRSYGARTFPVETSRGCPFACAFCTTVGMWGRRVAFRSVDKVIEQIRRIPEKKGSMLLFHDMNFTLNKDYVKRLCQALKDNNINIPWHCSTRLDLVDKELLRVMKDAGCAVIFFGVESLSRAMLKRMNKGYTPEKAIESVRLTADMGIKVRLSFIIGLPGETEQTLKESLTNCMKLGPGVEAHVNPLMIIPGSATYAQAVREGFDESWWLKDHDKAIPLYEGAVSLRALEKWERVFNAFRFSDRHADAAGGIDDVVRDFHQKQRRP